MDFLGAPAAFPVAPFRIASVLGANRASACIEAATVTICMRAVRRSDCPAPRAEVRCVVQLYVARIEHYVRDDPYNWFNWYDIWNSAEAPVGVSSAREANGIEAPGGTA